MSTPPIEIKRRLDAEVEKIRGFADLTDEAKRRRIAEAYAQAQADYNEARERVEKAERAVFATGYPFTATDSEVAQIRAARRAAYEGVYNSVAPAYAGGTWSTPARK